MDNKRIEIFADGANLQSMKEKCNISYISGFTTNPTLMKKAGVKDYIKFAQDAVESIPDLPISFEVFSDDFEKMKNEARKIAKIGKNVYVKIPITNSRGESSIRTIRELSKEGLKLNITAVFTIKQVKKVLEVLQPGSSNIISIFAGRIMDTGINAMEIVSEVSMLCKESGNARVLWASCREVYNIIQAEECGADIITVTDSILNKLSLLGKSLEEYSLETVKMFNEDSKAIGFEI